MRKIDRFFEYCQFRQLSNRDVTRMLDISEGLLLKSSKEGKDLSPKLLGIISNTFKDLNINWLINGE